MANVIREQRLIDNQKRTLVKYVATLDTAAANTTLLDTSSLRFSLNTNGQVMSANANIKGNYRTTIKRIYGQAKANAYFKILWQGSNTADIITINTGNFDYSFDSMGDGAVIANPETTSNGNILLNVVTPSSADTLTLFIDLRKDNRDYDAGQTADPVAFNRGPAAP
ncbi:hypothetical protein UFOVP908_126 [uncultured Caudovirales phage]|uniref:Uncharacterized protein n=1 Tax=uncultured Caudovirales phage TaxID=2100421 RepID=A0A6J5PNQ9_9CAUD|nr:hypothetical protein UFOVP908_126 [uncultured Caudovirales phage]CAB4176166.1 hypothetical protein UFOVP990_10 [uncultured Caudovirales phage]CAB4181572.1 hypothetical protein UFOVP1065_41 [uncultured Caudovirales phage]CAB4189699.1 hypothetical protein UFOVP1198_10 [uncultured Caudovirales phage]CAB4210306.1 hypothetical protein UFOVP1418_2 [uncultured Caudovirales phage]